MTASDHMAPRGAGPSGPLEPSKKCFRPLGRVLCLLVPGGLEEVLLTTWPCAVPTGPWRPRRSASDHMVTPHGAVPSSPLEPSKNYTHMHVCLFGCMNENHVNLNGASWPLVPLKNCFS